jgi:hypothetical protein
MMHNPIIKINFASVLPVRPFSSFFSILALGGKKNGNEVAFC